MSEAWLFEAQYLQLPQIVASLISFYLRITEKWYKTVFATNIAYDRHNSCSCKGISEKHLLFNKLIAIKR